MGRLLRRSTDRAVFDAAEDFMAVAVGLTIALEFPYWLSLLIGLVALGLALRERWDA